MGSRSRVAVRAVLLFAFASLGCGADLSAYASGALSLTVDDAGVAVSLEANSFRCPTLRSDVRATVNGKAMTRTDAGGKQSCGANANVNCTGAELRLAWPDAKKEKRLHVELTDGKRTIVMDVSQEARGEDMFEVVSPKTAIGLSMDAEVRVRIRPGLGRWGPAIGSSMFWKKKGPRNSEDMQWLTFERTSDTEGVLRVNSASQHGPKLLSISKAGETEISFTQQVEPILRCEGVEHCHGGATTEGRLVMPASFK